MMKIDEDQSRWKTIRWSFNDLKKNLKKRNHFKWFIWNWSMKWKLCVLINFDDLWNQIKFILRYQLLWFYQSPGLRISKISISTYSFLSSLLDKLVNCLRNCLRPKRAVLLDLVFFFKLRALLKFGFVWLLSCVPKCTMRWRFTVDFCVNDLSQTLHLNGFSPKLKIKLVFFNFSIY